MRATRAGWEALEKSTCECLDRMSGEESQAAAQHCACRQQSGYLFHDHIEDDNVGGAERHPHADLYGPLIHVGGRQPIDARLNN